MVGMGSIRNICKWRRFDNGMAMMKDLQDYEKEIHACVKCGQCQAHCPVYRQGRREGDVARGENHARRFLPE